MIDTIYGKMDEDKLEKRVVPQQGTDEVTDIVATEYWLDGELVHRSLTASLVGRDMGSVQEEIA